jgi:uncharacterized membrane protein
MSDPTPDEVIRLAQQQIAARRAEDEAWREADFAAVSRRERPWRLIFAGIFGLLLVTLLFWPGQPLEWKMYAVVHGVCAQQHNIFLGGLQFPLCARNSGIYLSFLLTTIYIYAIGRGRASGLPPWPIVATLVGFIAIMAVDGFNSLAVDIGRQPLYRPDNFVRTLTGMGMGIAIGVLLHLVLVKTLRHDADDDTRILKGWGELIGIIAVNLLVLAAIYGNLSFMFWPLAFLAFFGITGVLYMVSLLLTSLVMGYEGRVTRITQLARPATLALVPTLIILGVMSWLRFWLEGQGLII